MTRWHWIVTAFWAVHLPCTPLHAQSTPPSWNEATASAYAREFLAGVKDLDQGALAAADEHFANCLELSPANANCAYYRACIAGRGKSKSLWWLDSMVAWGYPDAAMLEWEPDFAFWRDEPAFLALLSKIPREGTPPIPAERANSKASIEITNPEVLSETHGVVHSPDGIHVALSLSDCIAIVDVRTGRTQHVLCASAEGRGEPSYSLDGSLIACADFDGGWSVYDAATSKLRMSTPRTSKSSSDLATGVAFSPDNEQWILWEEGTDPVVWDLRNQKRRYTASLPLDSSVRKCVWKPDGTTIAIALDEAFVFLMDAWSGALLGDPLSYPGRIRDIAFSPRGDHLAVGGDAELVRVWDLRERRLLHDIPVRLQPFAGTVELLAFDREGKRLYSAMAGGSDCFLHDVSSGELIWHSESNIGSIIFNTSLSLSPDGRKACMSARHGGCEVIDVESGTQLSDLTGLIQWEAAYVSNGECILGIDGSAPKSERLRLLGAEHGELRYERFQGHAGSYLTSTPQGYVDGSGGMLRDAMRIEGEDRHSLLLSVDRILDPKRVRAIAAGVPIRVAHPKPARMR